MRNFLFPVGDIFQGNGQSDAISMLLGTRGMVNLALGFLSVLLEIDSRAMMTILIYGHSYGNVIAFMVERDLKAMGSVTLADHPIIYL